MEWWWWCLATLSDLLKEYGVTSVVSLVLGAAGTKGIDYVFQSKKARIDELAAFRKELLDVNDTLNGRIDALQKEVDTWKGKYYELLEENLLLKTENESIRRTVEELKATFTLGGKGIGVSSTSVTITGQHSGAKATDSGLSGRTQHGKSGGD
jgi:vacuolar-type H+-ATPase subunit I/STV1